MTAIPFIPGITISRRMTSKILSFKSSSASWPSDAVSTENPFLLSSFLRSLRIGSSSSTTSILIISRRCGKPYAECRALALITDDVDTAVMVLHNLVADRQTKAGPLPDGLGCIEGIEYLVNDFLRYPCA